jgi:hypothetical protein
MGTERIKYFSLYKRYTLMTGKEKIQIPVWLLTLILSGLIGLFSYSITFAISYANIKKDTVTNSQSISDIKTREIVNLQNNKADKAEVSNIEITLVRIENKLDNYILTDKKK